MLGNIREVPRGILEGACLRNSPDELSHIPSLCGAKSFDSPSKSIQRGDPLGSPFPFLLSSLELLLLLLTWFQARDPAVFTGGGKCVRKGDNSHQQVPWDIHLLLLHGTSWHSELPLYYSGDYDHPVLPPTHILWLKTNLKAFKLDCLKEFTTFDRIEHFQKCAFQKRKKETPFL